MYVQDSWLFKKVSSCPFCHSRRIRVKSEDWKFRNVKKYHKDSSLPGLCSIFSPRFLKKMLWIKKGISYLFCISVNHIFKICPLWAVLENKEAFLSQENKFASVTQRYSVWDITGTVEKYYYKLGHCLLGVTAYQFDFLVLKLQNVKYVCFWSIYSCRTFNSSHAHVNHHCNNHHNLMSERLSVMILWRVH